MAPVKTFEEYQAEKREREWQAKAEARKAAMGNAERVQRAGEWKAIGNEKFKAGNLPEARDYYREAIIFVEDLVDARRKERVELLMPLYANLAQVYLKLGEPRKAEEACGRALAIAEVPRNGVAAGLHGKAQFRRGMARLAEGRLEEARDDFAAALRLQPSSEEAAGQLAAVRAVLAEQAKQAKAQMGGFLQRDADREAQRLKAQERRKERLALAEQRQQMQTAFSKLSTGAMLYEQREKEMEPVRQKEQEKRRTLELEQSLTNILDEAKGAAPTDNFDDFMQKKMERCKDQHAELDQKKKILDKKSKEERWEEDDVWKGHREQHRQQLAESRARGTVAPAPKTMWEAKEVARWCEQSLRAALIGAHVDGEELPEELVSARLETSERQELGEGPLILKALVTDVLALEGDACVVRLNLSKPPLHYFDYFLKLEWEVTITRPGQEVYRTAEELITVAALESDGKAPASIARHRLVGGTFKLLEFCSEELPAGGEWPLEAKVRAPGDRGPDLAALAEALRDRLKSRVLEVLNGWIIAYQEYWS